MVEAEAMALLAEAKAHVRLGDSGEDGLLLAMLRSAAELCERFTGEALLIRGHAEMMRPSAAWSRLGAGPVRAVQAVESVAAGGGTTALPPAAYAIDIDATGRGWVRVIDAGEARRVRVRFTAGLATGWDEVPDALRHGIIRLATHFYMTRDGGVEAPPAAVAALWRPWRRLTLGGV